MKGSIKDILLVAFIGALIYLRWKNETASWIGLVTYVGALVALADLFYECILAYKNRIGIGIFILINCVIGIFLMIFFARIFTGDIIIDIKMADILTLVALVISLPHELYIRFVGVLLYKTKENDENE